MAEKKTVYLSEFIHPAARTLLEKYVRITDDWSEIPKIDGLINRNLVKIDKAVLDEAVNLKVIGIHGTGKDGVDVKEADSHGVEVFSTPGINARSVAELNAALVLDLSRKITKAARQIYAGKDMGRSQSVFRGHEISGKTVGLIGMGNIATLTAAIFRDGFGCPVTGWSRSFSRQRAEELKVGYAGSMEEVLKQADIVILALALTPETFHIFGQKEFELCKNTAIFINTARGKLVDEDALLDALKRGEIAAAACDVFENEPVSAENPLISFDNFLPTPHLGANTEEALYRVGMEVVTGMLRRLHIPYREC